MADRRFGLTNAESIAEYRPGRDGQALDLAAKVLVSGPKEPPRFASFDVSNPIEKMRLKGTLGDDEAESVRRYKAARVFARLYDMAHPGARCPMMGERVDGSSAGDENARLNRMQANNDLVRMQLEARGMTLVRFLDIEAVVAKGIAFNWHAKASGRDYSTVRENVLAGLDAIAGYEPWQRRFDEEPVMRIYDDKQKTKKRS